MKQCIYIILVSVLLSGCATKAVTKMAEGDSFKIFYGKQVSQAYFNPTTNELLVDVARRHKRDKQQEQKCFSLDLTEALTLRTQPLTFSADRVTTCPEDNNVLYDHIPVLYDGISVKKFQNRSVPRNGKPSVWQLWSEDHQSNRLWLISTSNSNDIIALEIPTVTKRKPAAYLLYPFSLAADIVTSPYQLFLYLLLTNALSVT